MKTWKLQITHHFPKGNSGLPTPPFLDMFPAVHLFWGCWFGAWWCSEVKAKGRKNMGENFTYSSGVVPFMWRHPLTFRRRFPHAWLPCIPLKRDHFKRTFHLNQPSFSRRSVSFQGVNPLKRIVGCFVGTETSTILSSMGFGLSLEACC